MSFLLYDVKLAKSSGIKIKITPKGTRFDMTYRRNISWIVWLSAEIWKFTSFQSNKDCKGIQVVAATLLWLDANLLIKDSWCPLCFCHKYGNWKSSSFVVYQFVAFRLSFQGQLSLYNNAIKTSTADLCTVLIKRGTISNINALFRKNLTTTRM